ncbi:RNA polymerase sigma-70 factor, ECF subfamily [bacterium A37T11]|nr:RNA polymerase sigma-70 factor, ECF subfamily [bacterium A37T11]
MSSCEQLSDERLLELIAQNNEKAFNTLYNRYWEKLLQVATYKTQDIMEAENIVQDLFVSLWKRRADLDIRGDFSHYLLVSVKYRVIKVLNKQRSRRLYEERSINSVDLLDNTTQQLLDFRELQQQLEALVGALPEKIQLIYRMNKEEGKSYKEIASTLNMSEKAVDAHLVRVKKRLWSSLSNFLSVFLL